MTVPTDPVPPPTLGALLNDTARLMRRRFDQCARHLGLTRAQWNVIAMLSRCEGIHQAGLADLLEVEPITLCRLVDRMEEGGWVERRPDPNDRRARRLFMTDKARSVLQQARDIASGVYAEALEGLPPETERQMIAILSHMRANLADRRSPTAAATSAAAEPRPGRADPPFLQDTP
ncbi:MarR family winged helix-turn-helix transcriptional regulator [Azospirillum thermophilum]|uniref:MarR family transcriptional regulator n=1 Tax=Azospirillum thermophilum TaxID=2202148 RepID=A0A2S2CL78_9PROT|nr:MarR family transcriptional regulator [Azospirillum thermophilum]AWK85253.1 MarR family transcriptional regulator [Azospirillum thermophilum]